MKSDQHYEIRPLCMPIVSGVN